MLLGLIKSHSILDRSAHAGIERIRRFADHTCIGAVYSWRTWLLVVLMMGLGLIGRTVPVPPLPVGTMLVAVGWALVYSSRHGWLAWVQWEKGA